MKQATRMFKALADETRLRALAALTGRELCVCQLIELLHLAPSTISKHLALLHQAGLLERRKCGRWIYYRGVSAKSGPLAGKLLGPLFQSLENDPQIAADRKHLARLQKMNLEELCRKITKR